MSLLVLGVVAFAVLHLVPVWPGAKTWLVGRLGNRAYGPVYGMASIVALVLIIAGWRTAAFVPVYDPPAWGAYANFALTLVAFILVGIFLFRGRMRQTLRFPMGFAVMFWGTGHLLANGDVRSLILFGGLMAYAVLHVGLGLAQGLRPSPVVRDGHDLLSVLAGIALYGLMTQLHAVLIGVPIVHLAG
jgi:uncharacterized membrane protein